MKNYTYLPCLAYYVRKSPTKTWNTSMKHREKCETIWYIFMPHGRKREILPKSLSLAFFHVLFLKYILMNPNVNWKSLNTQKISLNQGYQQFYDPYCTQIYPLSSLLCVGCVLSGRPVDTTGIWRVA